jgi:hypothetical protein
MKVLDLKCALGHAFEGWFASNEAFEEQQAAGLVECPLCGDKAVIKQLSAPRLNFGAVAPSSADQPAKPAQEEASPALRDVQARWLHAKRAASTTVMRPSGASAAGQHAKNRRRWPTRASRCCRWRCPRRSRKRCNNAGVGVVARAGSGSESGGWPTFRVAFQASMQDAQRAISLSTLPATLLQALNCKAASLA